MFKQDILAGEWSLSQLGELCPLCRSVWVLAWSVVCMDRYMSVGTPEPMDGVSRCLCVFH